MNEELLLAELKKREIVFADFEDRLTTCIDLLSPPEPETSYENDYVDALRYTFRLWNRCKERGELNENNRQESR